MFPPPLPHWFMYMWHVMVHMYVCMCVCMCVCMLPGCAVGHCLWDIKYQREGTGPDAPLLAHSHRRVLPEVHHQLCWLAAGNSILLRTSGLLAVVFIVLHVEDDN